jgi:hypothetical protein
VSFVKAKTAAQAVKQEDVPRDILGRRIWCRAKGCPMKASVFMEGESEVCSWHAKQPFSAWPHITQELHDCVARGDTPRRPELPIAPIVRAMAEKVRNGPKGRALQEAMAAPADFNAADLAERKRRAQEATDRYQREHA